MAMTINHLQKRNHSLIGCLTDRSEKKAIVISPFLYLFKTEFIPVLEHQYLQPVLLILYFVLQPPVQLFFQTEPGREP